MQTPLLLQFGSGTDTRVEVRELEVHLEPVAGGYQLVVTGAASFTSRPNTLSRLPLLMTGEVHAEVGTRLNLGPLLAGHRGELPVLPRSIPVPTSWVVALSYDALDDLERHRGGQDLTLILSVHATLTGGTPAHCGMDEAVASAQVPIRVRQGEWVRQLEETGAVAGVLIVVHPRPHAAGTRYAEAMGYLRAARQLLAGGQYPQAVSEARKVLDVLNEIDPAPAGDPPNVPARQRTKSQRWFQLRKAVTELANPAPHGDAAAAAVTWDHADAQAVLGTVASLLARR